MATADMFIKFDGVTGESQQKGFEGWIEIVHSDMSSSAPVSTGTTGGSGTGKPTVHGYSFSAIAGRHTPDINKRYFEGKHFPKVEVKYVKQTGDATAQTYYHLTMENVFVGNISSSKATNSDANESFQLHAEKYTQEYFAQDSAGALKSVGSTSYNQKTNESA